MRRRKLHMLDLFSGLGGASAAMRERGWKVTSADIDPALNPDVVADLATWTYDGPLVDLLWASPPCQEFSRHGMPWLKQTAPAPSLDLLRATMRIVREVDPLWWVVENVRGAIPFFNDELGREPIQIGACCLWGIYPDPRPVKVPFRKQRLSGRNVAERSRTPYAVSEALAQACDSTIFTLADLR